MVEPWPLSYLCRISVATASVDREGAVLRSRYLLDGVREGGGASVTRPCERLAAWPYPLRVQLLWSELVL